MDSRTLENWKKIKEVMEQSGNTQNNFYRRACAILQTAKDPFEALFPPK